MPHPSLFSFTLSPTTSVTPEWVRHAVFYQIFPDRFATSPRAAQAKPARLESWDSPPTVHGYKGGDLWGVIEKLDYLKALGITALYFTPIFQSGSNHRYHTHDYFQVDPMLGGNAAFHDLIDACHAHGIRVVIDGVFNHASRGFFQFHDILENKEHSPYRDWFHIRKFPLNAYTERDIGYDAWWGLAALPKFNTSNPEVRTFLFSVAEYWLTFGIDGWRLDVPNEISDDLFWQEFRERCRSINPECYIVGEIWDDASHWLQGDQFDAVMNYEFTRAIFGFVGARTLNHEQISKCGYVQISSLSGQSFAGAIHELLHRYPQEATGVQLNLLGSHDTPRALTILGEDEGAWRMAYGFLMSFTGAPCVYYGDELGLHGNHDPYCRQSMPWQRSQNWNHSLLAYIKALIQLRHAHPVLRVGAYHTLYADEILYIYARTLGDEMFIGVINASDQEIGLTHPLTLPKERLSGQYQSALTEEVTGQPETYLRLAEDVLQGGMVPARSVGMFMRVSD